MDLSELTNTDVASTVAGFGILLLILALTNWRQLARIRGGQADTADLERRLEHTKDVNIGLDQKLAVAHRKLAAEQSKVDSVRCYADQVSESSNAVYIRVGRELRDILNPKD